MAFLSRDSRAGVPKSRPAGLPGLWSPITLRADLGSKCGLKQSCSSRRELFNGMSHVVCSQVFRVDSRLLVVGSQNWQTPGSSTPGSSTPGPSFGHNLCFRCPNEQWEPILDIYASRYFHWYKERHKPLRFDPSNWSLKFRESTGTPSPKAGVALGVWGFTPSHFPTLPGVPDVTPGLPFGPHPCNPFALVASPKLGLRQKWFKKDRSNYLHPFGCHLEPYTLRCRGPIVLFFGIFKKEPLQIQKLKWFWSFQLPKASKNSKNC
jgi:hypothetical protein